MLDEDSRCQDGLYFQECIKESIIAKSEMTDPDAEG